MGAALEWLGPEGCRSIAERILREVDTSRPGGEVWAACPWHTEGTVGGSFSYNPENDSAHCFSCGEGGDLISVYAALNDMDDATAFKAFKAEYAPGAVATPKTPQTPVRREWVPAQAEPSPALWQERATEFVRHACARLESNRDVITQLEAWGVSLDAARACMIGWNDEDKSVPRESWGMDPVIKDGKSKKVWLPKGLILPMLAHGRVVKIKIRRPNESLQLLLPDLRYWEVPGSTKIFHRYGRDAAIWVLVETERDASMIWSRVRDLGIGALATGGASKRPDGDTAAIIRASELVLNSLDFDEAGAVNSARFWDREFPQCKRWPAPPSMGKDAGDAFGAGLDIRAWVLAGLPSHIRRSVEQRKQTRLTQEAVSEIAAPGVKEAEYRVWYLGKCVEFIGLMQNTPVLISSSRGVTMAPMDWSLDPKNWSLLRRLESMLREIPVMDLVLEAGGYEFKEVDVRDLEAALPKIREWIGGGV
jgi:hypothetical protein